jgi:predicted nucleic acid-binding protein
MKPLLLDSSVIVDVLRKRNERHVLVEHLLDQGQPLTSCPTTLTEIYAGMRPSEEKPTRAFMKSLLFLAITEDIAEQARRLKAQYARRGRTLSFQDASIAAVCIAYGCTLVTENARVSRCRSFSSIPSPRKPRSENVHGFYSDIFPFSFNILIKSRACIAKIACYASGRR